MPRIAVIPAPTEALGGLLAYRKLPALGHRTAQYTQHRQKRKLPSLCSRLSVPKALLFSLSPLFPPVSRQRAAAVANVNCTPPAQLYCVYQFQSFAAKTEKWR